MTIDKDGLEAAKLAFSPDPDTIYTPYISAAIASLTARAQAAEASLASAREDAIDDTAAAQWLRTWVKRKFGVWITWRTAWSAIKEMRAQPTALNKDVR